MKKINQLKAVMTRLDIRTCVRIEGGVRLHSIWDKGDPSVGIFGADSKEKVVP